MKSRIIFLLMLSLFLIGCTTSAESNTETTEEEQPVETNDSRVVTIQEKTFEMDDLDFYTLMNKVKLMLQKEADANENNVSYYEEQLEYYENINVNLQSLIELYAMSLLAEEKNYFVPDEKLRDAVEDFNEQVAGSEEATELVEEFGREMYNRNIEEYIRETILRDRIAGELEAELQEENPEAMEREINYLLEKKFEDLYMDQLSTLEMEIHLQ